VKNIFVDKNGIARKQKKAYSNQNILHSNGRHGLSLLIHGWIGNNSWVCVRVKFEFELREANPSQGSLPLPFEIEMAVDWI
jgi:hypothetical protein